MPTYAERIVADGAVAYWRLGETSSTTIASAVVGPPAGTLAGAYTLGIAGAVNDGTTGIAFNPVGAADGRAEIPVGSYSAIGTGPATLECWMRFPPTIAVNQNIFQTTDLPNTGIGFYVDTTNVVVGVRGPASVSSVYAHATLRDGNWHHVVGVLRRGAPDTLELWVDGVRRASNGLPSNGADFTSTRATYIGSSGTVSEWLGALDECAIYKRDLTGDEIAAHYAAAAKLYADVVLADGASAYWPLHETSGTIVRSLVAGVPDGTLSGAVTLGVSGPLAQGGTAMAFNPAGAADGNVSIPVGRYSAQDVAACSIECWMRAASLPAATTPILFGTADPFNAWPRMAFYADVALSVVRLRVGTAAASINVQAPLLALLDGRWHHLVGVRRIGAPNDTFELWVDGVLVATLTQATGWNLTPTQPTKIGGRATTDEWTGEIAECAIYKVALAPAQIQQHYQLRATPYSTRVLSDGGAAYWRLDDTAGTVARSLTGAPHGTIAGAVTLGAAGALADTDRAMTFNPAGAADGGVYPITRAPWSEVGPTVSCSIEGWFRRSALPVGSGGNGEVMVTTCPAYSTFAGVILHHGAGSKTIAFDTRRTSPNETVSITTPITALCDGRWHHVVGVLRRSSPDDAHELWVDGVLVASTMTPAGRDYTSTQPGRIGADSTIGEFQGDLDEIAFYHRALSASDIAAHYALRAREYREHVINDGAQAYWRLNETSGTVARNLIAGAPDGTIAGAVTLNVAGALADGDKAMTFNPSGAADGRVALPFASWDDIGTGPATVECWFKTSTLPVTSPECIFWTANAAAGSSPNLGIQTAQSTMFLAFRSESPVGNQVNVTTAVAPYCNGVWHHAVGVVRRGTPNDTHELWIDGALIASNTTVPTGRNYTATYGGRIGAADTTNEFSGSVDECAVYKVALTPAQIAAHYAARLIAPTQAVAWTVTGALQVDGSVIRTAVQPWTVSGGLTASGTALVAQHQTRTVNGALSVTGAAVSARRGERTGAGGVRVSGSVVWTAVQPPRWIVSGGLRASGAVLLARHQTSTRSGSLTANGTVLYARRIRRTVTGGVKVSGTSTLLRTRITTGARLNRMRLNAARLNYRLDPPSKPSNPSPADGALITTQPVTLSWTASTGATSYVVHVGNRTFTTTSPSLTLPANYFQPGQKVRWWVEAKNVHGTTAGPIWSFRIYVRKLYTQVAVSLQGVWTDITRDVLLGTLDCEYGLTGNRPTDSLAGSGTLRWALRNDRGNSGGRDGYYSPYHANCRPGWTAGIECYVAVGTAPEDARIRFRGRINDIDPMPGPLGGRRVDVVAYDRMRDLLDTDLFTIALATNKTEADLLGLIFTALDASVRPVSWTLDTGIDQFPVAFDDIGEGVKAGALVGDILRSSYGLGFIVGNGVFRYVSRNTRATLPPTVALDRTMTDIEAAISVDRAYNVVRTTTHPRSFDATPVVLWAATGTPPEIPVGATPTVIEGTFRSPSDVERLIGALSTIALVPGTDWAANSAKDGTGTTLTANVSIVTSVSAARVTFSITNSSGTTAYLVKGDGTAFLQMRGQGIYDNGPRTFRTASTQPYGLRQVAVDLPYQAVDATGQQIADIIHTQYASLGTQVERVSMRVTAAKTPTLFDYLLTKDIGDAVTLTESMTGLTGVPAMILGVRLHWLTDQVLEGHWMLGPVVRLSPPSVPTGVAATVLAENVVRVTWATGTAGSYTQVYFNGVHQGTAGIGATSLEVGGLVPLTTYSVTLRHMYFGMPSPFTAAVNVQPRLLASGGTTYDSGGYRYHVFTADGTFTITAAGTTDRLLVGGGGGGGGAALRDPDADHGGGAGGGGELVELFNNWEPVGVHAVVVGQGGAAGFYQQNFGTSGGDGTDTTYRTDRAGHGGGGAGASGGRSSGGGACGGGASSSDTDGVPGGVGGSASAGYRGGDGGLNVGGSTAGAGGGGMTSAGGPATTGTPGAGRTAFDGQVYGAGGRGGRTGTTGASPANSGKGGDGGQRPTNSGNAFAGAAGKVVIRYRI